MPKTLRLARPASLALAALAAALLLLFVAATLAGLPRAADTLPSLAVALLVHASAVGFGALALRALPPLDRLLRGGERALTASVLGLGALALAMLGLGLLGLVSRVASMLLLGAGLVLLATHARQLGIGRFSCRMPRGVLGMVPAMLVTLPVLGGALLCALPPPSWFDALQYHLVIAATYVLEGRLVEMPVNFFSHLPHGAELLDALVLSLGRDLRVAPMHWGMGVIAVLVIAQAARRHVHRAAGPLAAAVFLSLQEAALSNFVEGVDMALCACVVLAADLLLRARRGADRGLVVAAFLVAGLGGTFKIHGLPYAAALAACALVLGRLDLRTRIGWTWAAAAGAACLLPVLPWLLLGLAWHGNPIHPFLGGLLGRPEDHAWVEWIAAHTRGEGLGGGSLVNLARELATLGFEPGKWTPLALVALATPLAWRARSRARELLLLATVLGLTWVVTAPLLRYGLPVAGLVAACAAGTLLRALARMPSRSTRMVGAAFAAVALAASTLTTLQTMARSRDPIPWLIGSEETAGYERRSVRDSPQPLFRQASAVLPDDSRVLSLDEPRMYGLWRPFVAATVFDRPALTLFLRAGETPEGVAPAEVARRIRAAGFTHVLTNPAFTRHQLEAVGSPWRNDAVEALAAAIVTGHARLVLQDGSARLYELP